MNTLTGSGPLFLIGFPGSGKTTLGKAAAEFSAAAFGALSLEYIDLDDEIERRAGMTVAEYFAARGERSFRTLESEVLRELSSRDNVIIGCGGGTPCHSGNMELMNRRGVTVLLEASPDVLLRRLLDAQDKRPMLRGFDAAGIAGFIRQKMEERAPYYDLARLRFPSDELEDSRQIDRSVVRFFDMLRRAGIYSEL